MARNGKVTAWTVVSIVFGAVFIAACIVLVLTTRGREQNYDDYKNETTAESAQERPCRSGWRQDWSAQTKGFTLPSL